VTMSVHAGPCHTRPGLCFDVALFIKSLRAISFILCCYITSRFFVYESLTKEGEFVIS